ncbi:MAG: hypothetical protein NVSMB14_16680 [Isosphaeraceae bacterium]
MAVLFCYVVFKIEKDSLNGFTSDARPIRAVLDHQAADWNRGDLDAFLEGDWNSPKLVFQSGGDRIEGFDNVRERYRKRYLGKKETMGTLAFFELEVEPLGYYSAFARGKFHLTFAGKPPLEGRFTLFLRRFKNEWKIVHDHTSAAP